MIRIKKTMKSNGDLFAIKNRCVRCGGNITEDLEELFCEECFSDYEYYCFVCDAYFFNSDGYHCSHAFFYYDWCGAGTGEFLDCEKGVQTIFRAVSWQTRLDFLSKLKKNTLNLSEYEVEWLIEEAGQIYPNLYLSRYNNINFGGVDVQKNEPISTFFQIGANWLYTLDGMRTKKANSLTFEWIKNI